MYDHFNPEVII